MDSGRGFTGTNEFTGVVEPELINPVCLHEVSSSWLV